MTPTARNAAIATAATLIPAAIAAAFYPDRARALPGQIADRARDAFDDSDDFETRARRTIARLESLTDGLDRFSRPSTPTVSAAAMIAGGIVAALAVPAALAAFFPDRARAYRDAAIGYFRSDDEAREELSRVSERLNSLSKDIERQRSSNYDDVVSAAKKSD